MINPGSGLTGGQGASREQHDFDAWVARATDAGSEALARFITDVRKDGFQWRDLIPALGVIVREVVKVTGEWLRSDTRHFPREFRNSKPKEVAHAIAKRALVHVIQRHWQRAWDTVWAWFPRLARWVPGLKGVLGSYLRGQVEDAIDDLIVEKVEDAKAAPEVLA